MKSNSELSNQNDTPEAPPTMDLRDVEKDPLSPETRAGLDRVIELEDRRLSMLQRAESEVAEVRDLTEKLEGAEEALSSAEAAEVVEPTDDATAAADAARARVSDLSDARKQAARRRKVLVAEAEKLDPQIRDARAEAYRSAVADLEKLGNSAGDEVRDRLADLVPQLRRQAAVIDACARLEGGLAGITFSVGKRLKETQDALRLAGEHEHSWHEADDQVVEARGIAAYLAPNPEVIQPAWLNDALGERFWNLRR